MAYMCGSRKRAFRRPLSLNPVCRLLSAQHRFTPQNPRPRSLPRCFAPTGKTR
nr:MAG TPA: hypothetical protein [Caudoviricetes sp.]